MGAKPADPPFPREEDWVLTAKRHVPISWVHGSGCCQREVLEFFNHALLAKEVCAGYRRTEPDGDWFLGW